MIGEATTSGTYIIDLTIMNGKVMTNIIDNTKTQREKSVRFPDVKYEYKVISEEQNEQDPKLFHRRYEIRTEWAWKE